MPGVASHHQSIQSTISTPAHLTLPLPVLLVSLLITNPLSRPFHHWPLNPSFTCLIRQPSCQGLCTLRALEYFQPSSLASIHPCYEPTPRCIMVEKCMLSVAGTPALDGSVVLCCKSLRIQSPGSQNNFMGVRWSGRRSPAFIVFSIIQTRYLLKF